MQQQLLELVTQQFGLEMIEQRSPLVSPHPQPLPSGLLLDRLERGMDFTFADTN